jgi:hypothetical protein
MTSTTSTRHAGFFEAASPLPRADPPDLPALVAASARFDTRATGPPLTAGRALLACERTADVTGANCVIDGGLITTT